MKVFKTILLIILCLALGGGATYYYFEVYNKKDNTIPVKKETKKEITEELDIDSRLVHELYSMVSVEDLNNTWSADWMFSDTIDNREIKSFDVESGNESIKMHLVGININSINKKYIDCNDDIPAKFENYGASVCQMNKDGYEHEIQYGYTRKYIDSIYKKLFGPDAELDTSVPFRSEYMALNNYVYVPKLDMYVLYKIVGGGTSGPGGYKFTLEKATKKDKEILLDVKVVKTEYDDSGKNITNKTDYKFVYTFKLENDGMYSFVGRELID